MNLNVEDLINKLKPNAKDTIVIGMSGAGKSFNMLPGIWKSPNINTIDVYDSGISKSSNLRNMRIDLYDRITDIMNKGY